MKDAILAKLAEIEAMLLEVTCEGEQLAELDSVFEDVNDKLTALADAVDYYVD
jgi:hypothetical protein